MMHKSKTKTGYILLVVFSVLAIIAAILILIGIDESGSSDGIFRPILMMIGGFLTLGFSISAINQENKYGAETKQLTLVLIGSAILFGAMIFELAVDFSDAKRAYEIIDNMPSSYYSYSNGDVFNSIKKIYAGEIMTLISIIGIGLSSVGTMFAYHYENSYYGGRHLVSPTKEAEEKHTPAKASTKQHSTSKNNSSEDKLKQAFMDGIITAQEYEKKMKENKKK